MKLYREPTSGVIYGACDLDHASNYLLHYLRRDVIINLIVIEPEELSLSACVHCRWCGCLTFEPVDCALHDLECPEYVWELSERCWGFVYLYLGRTGAHEISGAVMHQAEELSLLNPLLGGPAIAEQILGWLGH
jgi:hypothetical protein